MSRSGTKQEANDPEFILIADHPALDMLNTEAIVDDTPIDFWETDQNIVRWLIKTGLAKSEAEKNWRSPELVEAAHLLRSTTRAMVEQRKKNRPIDIGHLNDLLAMGQSHLELVKGERGMYKLVRRYEHRLPKQLLVPLAESAANLLTDGDFNLIRRCEDPNCVLWFYDRTKSHRRRWCSMATCGNRNKVSAFRNRQPR